MSRCFVAALALSVLTASGSHALDADRYKEIVAQTISGLGDETVDVAMLKSFQEELIAIGIGGARDFAVSSPDDAELMTFVADSAPAMTAMSLDDIEMAWHDGEALSEIGVSVDDLDHFGKQISYMDAIIHPATALIALREYEATGDRSYLLQVKDELAEVVEHISHL